MPRIMSAPTGARRLKDAHPGIPLTTEEIAKTAREVADAGADEFHLHVRDDEGVHSLDAGRYREAMAAVAEAAPELDIQITTESAGIYEVEDQLACLDAITPTYATAAIRETMRDNAVAEKIYALTAERNIRMQHILFDREDIDLLRSAYASGMIAPESRDAIFVLGRYVPPRLAQAWELKPLLDEAARSEPGLGRLRLWQTRNGMPDRGAGTGRIRSRRVRKQHPHARRLARHQQRRTGRQHGPHSR